MFTTASTSASAPEQPVGTQIQRTLPVVALVWAANAIAETPHRVLAYLAERRRVARAVRELGDLSERMLQDIGLQRCDISRVVRYGRDESDPRSQLG